MRVLVTNDDGVESEGLHVLTAALAAAGLDVFVIAPNSDRSGTGAAIGLVHADQHLDSQQVELPGCAGIDAYAIDGPPGMCVIAGRLGAFGEPPDVVVSGINPGLNTGRAILHSGTVGAALTAQNFGGSGLAVSTELGDRWYWDTAARVRGRGVPAPARGTGAYRVEPERARASVRRSRRRAVGAPRRVRRGARRGRGHARRRAVRTARGRRDARARLGHRPRRSPASPRSPRSSGSPRPGRPELHDSPGLFEGVVPGAPVEPVHAIPDGSLPRWLHRPLPPVDGLV